MCWELRKYIRADTIGLVFIASSSRVKIVDYRTTHYRVSVNADEARVSLPSNL